jgi:hypothetical protein
MDYMKNNMYTDKEKGRRTINVRVTRGGAENNYKRIKEC